MAAKTGHMKYRTVSVYPQVDQQRNKAIERSPAASSAVVPAGVRHPIAELKRAGAKL
jgi:multiple sugar transport system substrate-binding protein